LIKKEKNKYVLYTRDGMKRLGSFDSKAKAVKREKEIQFFKNKKK
jgi:hypothetical protein